MTINQGNGMQHWITTQWPARGDDEMIGTNWHIWLPDGREHAAEGIAKGDIVFIYKSRTGRTRVDRHPDGTTTKIKCQIGPEAIIAICEVTGPVYEIESSEREDYVDGSSTWWRWGIPLLTLTTSGSVPRLEMNRILDYSPDYNLRGFGIAHSGLRDISGIQSDELIQLFNNRAKSLPVHKGTGRTGHKTPGGGEGPEHKALKEYVAADPAKALGENGLITENVEYQFPTGDRADIVLRDKYGRIIGLEVEVDVSDGQIDGLLQAIKYRRMMELVDNCNPGDSRSMLVAYTISDAMKRQSEKYGIEWFEIDRTKV